MKIDLVRHPKIGDIGIEIQIWDGHPIYSLTIEEAEMLSVMLMETLLLAGDPPTEEDKEGEENGL